MKGILILSILILQISCAENKNFKGQIINTQSEKNVSYPSDTLPPISDNIMSIYQDSKNNYWFGSWKDGVYRFDGKNIIHFTKNNGLPSDRVEEIKEDKSGNIFINTSKGLCKYDGQKLIVIEASSPHDGKWQLKPDDLWF